MLRLQSVTQAQTQIQTFLLLAVPLTQFDAFQHWTVKKSPAPKPRVSSTQALMPQWNPSAMQVTTTVIKCDNTKHTPSWAATLMMRWPAVCTGACISTINDAIVAFGVISLATSPIRLRDVSHRVFRPEDCKLRYADQTQL